MVEVMAAVARALEGLQRLRSFAHDIFRDHIRSPLPMSWSLAFSGAFVCFARR